MDSREVKIGHERVFLTLSDEYDGVSTRAQTGELWSVHARLVLPHLQASAQVHLSDPAIEQSLPQFFAELAEQWETWDGLKQWATYEGGLVLTCANDARGHVNVTVELRERSGHGWLVRGDVPLDSGQLEPLARDLGAFFV